MPSSCKEIRAMLADCLLNSPCVLEQKNSPTDCLQPPLLESLPTRCQQLKTGYGDCRRGWVDMRKRFRGNAPAALSKELEGSGLPSKQLYGGTPGYGGVKGAGDGEAEGLERKEE